MQTTKIRLSFGKEVSTTLSEEAFKENPPCYIYPSNELLKINKRINPFIFELPNHELLLFQNIDNCRRFFINDKEVIGVLHLNYEDMFVQIEECKDFFLEFKNVKFILNVHLEETNTMIHHRTLNELLDTNMVKGLFLHSSSLTPNFTALSIILHKLGKRCLLENVTIQLSIDKLDDYEINAGIRKALDNSQINSAYIFYARRSRGDVDFHDLHVIDYIEKFREDIDYDHRPTFPGIHSRQIDDLALIAIGHLKTEFEKIWHDKTQSF